MPESWRRAWSAYRDLRQLVDARVARDLEAATGLSMPDFEVLAETAGALAEDGVHCIRVNQLAARMRWSNSRLSRQLGRMQQRGLITREACELDGRGEDVVLTDAGRAAVDEAMPHHDAAVRAHFADLLTARQAADLAALCEGLVRRSGS